jgi:nitronate monooxygenase
MWSRNTLTDRLGLDCPIILAPMAGATTPELAAAVSNAGGLGSLGLATSPTDAAEEQIAAFRALSNRSLNINFFCHADPGDVSDTGAAMRARLQPYYTAKGLGDVPMPRVPYRPFGPEQLDLVLRHRPRVVSFHFGLPQPELLSSVKSSGAFVMSSATTVAEARRLEAQGVDAVIAQGLEAGGHRGTFLETDPTSQAGPVRAVAADNERGSGTGSGGWWYRRRQGRCRRAHAWCERGANRHGFPALPRGSSASSTPCRSSDRARRRYVSYSFGIGSTRAHAA